MKNVIKIFVAIAVMGVMSVSAFAQGAGPGGAKGGAQGGQRGPGGPGGPGGGGMRRGGRMKMDEEVLAKLNLTAGQKAKVKSLKEATQKKVQDLMKTMGPGPGAAGAGKAGGAGKPGAGGAGRPDPAKRKEMQEKFKPIMEGYTKGLKGILTPPQFTAYEKGMKEAMDKMRAQFGGGKAGGPGAGKGKGTPPPTA